MFKAALDRAKEQIDNAIDVLSLDGYPPLTEKLTLARLRKMDPKEAAAELQLELRRTMKKDEETNTPIPDNETIRLIRDYMAEQQQEAI